MKRNKKMNIVLSAHVAVNRTEMGVDYVQLKPVNPCVGLVEPFHGMGCGQMLSDGTFDFVHKPRKRSKPVLKLPHSSVSYGGDGLDRFTFTLPSSRRDEFSGLLLDEARKAARFVEGKLSGGAIW